jgi:hypothetical protein
VKVDFEKKLGDFFLELSALWFPSLLLFTETKTFSLSLRASLGALRNENQRLKNKVYAAREEVSPLDLLNLRSNDRSRVLI